MLPVYLFGLGGFLNLDGLAHKPLLSGIGTLLHNPPKGPRNRITLKRLQHPPPINQTPTSNPHTLRPRHLLFPLFLFPCHLHELQPQPIHQRPLPTHLRIVKNLHKPQLLLRRLQVPHQYVCFRGELVEAGLDVEDWEVLQKVLQGDLGAQVGVQAGKEDVFGQDRQVGDLEAVQVDGGAVGGGLQAAAREVD